MADNRQQSSYYIKTTIKKILPFHPTSQALLLLSSGDRLELTATMRDKDKRNNLNALVVDIVMKLEENDDSNEEPR